MNKTQMSELSVTPAEDVGRWIPVSEGLPEEHKEVLTCSLGGFIEIQSVEHDYWENQHGDWSDIDEVEVVAWMPLPEPYKASPANCSTCILDNTDACTRGAGRAADDEACEDYLASPAGAEGSEKE